MQSTWSFENMHDADTHNQFIYVSPNASYRVYIIDAEEMWMVNPEIIFQSNYRIAGTPNDVFEVLLSNDVSEEDADDVINNSLTYNNYNNQLKHIYQEEFKLYNEWKRNVIASNEQTASVKLYDMVVNVNPDFILETKNEQDLLAMGIITSQKGIGKSIKSTRSTRSSRSSVNFTENFRNKITNLKPGYVLDVSDLKTNGTGAKTIKIPQKTGKFGYPGLNIVSNNITTYKLAMSMLQGGTQAHQNQISYVTNLLNQYVSGTPLKTLLAKSVQSTNTTSSTTTSTSSIAGLAGVKTTSIKSFIPPIRTDKTPINNISNNISNKLPTIGVKSNLAPISLNTTLTPDKLVSVKPNFTFTQRKRMQKLKEKEELDRITKEAADKLALEKAQQAQQAQQAQESNLTNLTNLNNLTRRNISVNRRQINLNREPSTEVSNVTNITPLNVNNTAENSEALENTFVTEGIPQAENVNQSMYNESEEDLDEDYTPEDDDDLDEEPLELNSQPLETSSEPIDNSNAMFENFNLRKSL